MEYKYTTPSWCNPYSERDMELRFMLSYLYEKSKTGPISVLDVGFAGCGYIPQILDIPNIKYTGLDGDMGRISGRSLHMTEKDRQQWKGILNKINYIQSDIINYQADQKYDIVMSISVIEHIIPMGYSNSNNSTDSDIRAVNSMKHLVKDDGSLVLTFPCGITRRFISPTNKMKDELVKKGFTISRHDILIYDKDRYNQIIGDWNIESKMFSTYDGSKFVETNKEKALFYYHDSSFVKSICGLILGRNNE